MRSVLLVPLLVVAVGCEQPAAVGSAQREAKAAIDTREVQLPIALAAKARSFSDDHVLVLNVNRAGQISLASAVVRPSEFGLMKTQAEALAFFQLRVKEDREAAGAQARDKPLRSIILPD